MPPQPHRGDGGRGNVLFIRNHFWSDEATECRWVQRLQHEAV